MGPVKTGATVEEDVVLVAGGVAMPQRLLHSRSVTKLFMLPEQPE